MAMIIKLTVFLGSVVQDLENLSILYDMIQKIDHPKPSMLLVYAEEFDESFPELVVTSQFIEDVLTLPLLKSRVQTWDSLLEKKRRMFQDSVFIAQEFHTISLVDYALGHFTNILIHRQDVDNLNNYLNSLKTPTDFTTPLIIDIDECVLRAKEGETGMVVVLRPYLKQLLELLGLLSDQFEIFFHTLASKNTAETYLAEMKALFPNRELRFTYQLISYGMTSPITKFFQDYLGARYSEFQAGQMYGLDLRELKGKEKRVRDVFELLASTFDDLFSNKELHYLSEAKQKIAIILEDNTRWQNLPAERNPVDFYQISVFDKINLEDDEELKSFSEFLLARRMFHLNQAFASRTELPWRCQILGMYTRIQESQKAAGFAWSRQAVLLSKDMSKLCKTVMHPRDAVIYKKLVNI